MKRSIGAHAVHLFWHGPARIFQSISAPEIVLAFVSISFATFFRMPLQPLLGTSSPFLFYLPGIVIVAAIFGFRSGVLTTFASVLPANYFLMAPEGAFGIDLVESCQIIAFSFAGVSVSWMGEKLHQERKLEEHLRSTLACIDDALISTDSEGRIVFVNAQTQLLSEVQKEFARGRRISEVFDLREEGNDCLTSAFEKAIHTDDLQNLPRHITLVSASGRAHRLDHRCSRILGPTGQKLGVVFVFHPALEATASPIST